MQIPTPLRSGQIFMKDVECPERNKKIIAIFIFRAVGWKFIENWDNFDHKNDHNSKIKIGKIGNLVFLSIQPIPDLPVGLSIGISMTLDALKLGCDQIRPISGRSSARVLRKKVGHATLFPRINQSNVALLPSLILPNIGLIQADIHRHNAISSTSLETPFSNLLKILFKLYAHNFCFSLF